MYLAKVYVNFRLQLYFPEFCVVSILDNGQMGYYDSNAWICISKTDGISDEAFEGVAQNRFWDMFLSMRKQVSFLLHHFNNPCFLLSKMTPKSNCL